MAQQLPQLIYGIGGLAQVPPALPVLDSLPETLDEPAVLLARGGLDTLVRALIALDCAFIDALPLHIVVQVDCAPPAVLVEATPEVHEASGPHSLDGPFAVLPDWPLHPRWVLAEAEPTDFATRMRRCVALRFLGTLEDVEQLQPVTPADQQLAASELVLQRWRTAPFQDVKALVERLVRTVGGAALELEKLRVAHLLAASPEGREAVVAFARGDAAPALRAHAAVLVMQGEDDLLAIALGDPTTAVRAHTKLAFQSALKADPEAAQAHRHAATTLAKRIGDRFCRYRITEVDVELAFLSGDLPGVRKVYERRRRRADNDMNRGRMLLLEGDVEAAREAFHHALVQARQRAPHRRTMAAAGLLACGVRTLGPVDLLSEAEQGRFEAFPQPCAPMLLEQAASDPRDQRRVMALAARLWNALGRSDRGLSALSRATSGPVPLGDYDLGEPLGEGAFGWVYRATHRPTGASVALKVLRDGGRFVELEREAVLQAGLWHPNVLAVLDLGEVDDVASLVSGGALAAGGAWMALPLIEGGSLSTPQPPSRLRSILLDVLDALAHCHARGVLHLDLKPANILMVGQRVRLADFGIAQALGWKGGVRGTPAYMAPEQWAGRPEVRTDLYAVGCLAYQLATGTPPFSGSVRALREAHQNATTPAVGSESLTEWIRWLTAKDPERRPSSAAEAALALVETGTVDPPGPEMRRPAARGMALTTLVWDDLAEVSQISAAPEEHGQLLGVPEDWRAPEAWTARAARPGLGLWAQRATPVVGRESIQDELWRRLRAAEQGTPSVTLLAGLPGLGRRALLAWLRHRVGELFVARVERLDDADSGAACPPSTQELTVVFAEAPVSLERAVAWLEGSQGRRAMLVGRAADGEAGTQDSTLTLPALSGRAMTSLALHLLDLRPEDAARIARRAAGNPGLLRTLLAECAERRWLHASPRGFVIEQSPRLGDTAVVPPAEAIVLTACHLARVPKRTLVELLSTLGHSDAALRSPAVLALVDRTPFGWRAHLAAVQVEVQQRVLLALASLADPPLQLLSLALLGDSGGVRELAPAVVAMPLWQVPSAVFVACLSVLDSDDPLWAQCAGRAAQMIAHEGDLPRAHEMARLLVGPEQDREVDPMTRSLAHVAITAATELTDPQVSMQALMAAVEGVPSGTLLEVHCATLLALGRFSAPGSDVRGLADRAVELWRQLDEPPVWVDPRALPMALALGRGDVVQARRCAERRHAGHSDPVAATLCFMLGEDDQAIDHVQAAPDIAERVAHRIAASLTSLARRDWDEAERQSASPWTPVAWELPRQAIRIRLGAGDPLSPVEAFIDSALRLPRQYGFVALRPLAWSVHAAREAGLDARAERIAALAEAIRTGCPPAMIEVLDSGIRVPC